MGACANNCKGSQRIDLEDSQNHLIQHLKHISSSEKRRKYESQMNKIDFAQIAKTFRKAQQSSIISSSTSSNEFEFKKDTFIPLNEKIIFKLKQTEQFRMQFENTGLQSIANKEVGVLIMSGRQSSHLSDIKHIGTYDIGLDSAASIFKILIKRLKNLCQLCGNSVIPVYIMTSTQNKHEIKSHFKQNNYFDYGSANVFFFSQEVGPLFNEIGQIALKEQGQILMAAQGNGMMFSEIRNKNLIAHFNQKGIKYLFVGPCDNLLLKIADPISLGFMIQQQKDVVGTCFEFNGQVQRKEDFGFYGTSEQQKIKIYENLSQNQHAAKWVNSGSCFFRVSFIDSIVNNPHKMDDLMESCHLKFIDKEIIDLSYSQKMPILKKCFCFQFFYHDIFAFAGKGKIGIMEIDQFLQFAQIKKMHGQFGMEAARKKMKQNHKKWVEDAGFELEGEGSLELCPQMTYFGKNLEQKLLKKGFKKKKISLPVYISRFSTNDQQNTGQQI